MWLGSKVGGVRSTVKERGIKGYGFVQRIMLAAGSGTERGEQAIADARFRICAKRCCLARSVLPYRLNETEHTLLDQVLPIASDEEERSSAGAHRSVVARDKKLFRFPAAARRHDTQLVVRAGC